MLDIKVNIHEPTYTIIQFTVSMLSVHKKVEILGKRGVFGRYCSRILCNQQINYTSTLNII